MLLKEIYKEAIDYIEDLEEQFDIFLDKEMFVENTLPYYFYITVNQDQNDIIVNYNFEVYEGSAQIVCLYCGTNNFEILEINKVLINHLEEF